MATWDKFLRNKHLKTKFIAITPDREFINILNEENDENLFWGVINKNGI